MLGARAGGWEGLVLARPAWPRWLAVLPRHCPPWEVR